MTVDENKALVRRLVEDAVNRAEPTVIDEVAEGPIADAARRWIGPFRDAFPDFEMKVADLIAEDDKVAAHFKCSGTHRGEWRGVAPTGNRFEEVDEIYVFEIRNGKLAGVSVALEDDLARMRQLGIDP